MNAAMTNAVLRMCRSVARRIAIAEDQSYKRGTCQDSGSKYKMSGRVAVYSGDGQIGLLFNEAAAGSHMTRFKSDDSLKRRR